MIKTGSVSIAEIIPIGDIKPRNILLQSRHDSDDDPDGAANQAKVVLCDLDCAKIVEELYKTNEFAIYPSLVESFGLPLIEAVNYDCKLIASDLPYVHSVVKPSFVFKPHSTKSISEAILQSVSTNLPKSEVLIENRLESLIALLIK